MKTMNVTEFEKHRPLNGVYVFSLPSECPLCPVYIKSLANKNTYDWTVVECKPEDKEWAVKKMLIHGFPSTKVYVDDMCVYDREGVLFDVQLRELTKLKTKYGV